MIEQRMTFAQAATVLGCHVSNVPKLVVRGLLHSGGRRPGGALDRAEVKALAEQRRIRRTAPPRAQGYRRVDHRPDHDREWLAVREVAELLGVTGPAVLGRVHRGRLPATENRGRWWIRRDHLEQVEAARLAAKTRRP